MLGVVRMNSIEQHLAATTGGSNHPHSIDKKAHATANTVATGSSDAIGSNSNDGGGGGSHKLQYGSADNHNSKNEKSHHSNNESGDAPLFALVFNGGSAELFPSRIGTGGDKNAATRLGNANGSSSPQVAGGNNTITGHPGPAPAVHRERPPLAIRLDMNNLPKPESNSEIADHGSSGMEETDSLVSNPNQRTRPLVDENEYPIKRGSKVGGGGDSCPRNPQTTRVFSNSTPDPHAAASSNPRFGATTPMKISRCRSQEGGALASSPAESDHPFPPSVDLSRLARSNTETTTTTITSMANNSNHSAGVEYECGDEEDDSGSSSVRPHLIHLRPSSRQVNTYGSSPLDGGGPYDSRPASKKGEEARGSSLNSSSAPPLLQPPSAVLMTNQPIFPQGSSHHSFRSGDLNHQSHHGNSQEMVAAGSVSGSGGDIPCGPVIAVLSSGRRLGPTSSPIPSPAMSSVTGPSEPPAVTANRKNLYITVNSNGGSEDPGKNTPGSGGGGGMQHSPGVLSQGSPGFTDDVLSPVPSFFETKVPPPRLSSPSPANSGQFQCPDKPKSSAADSRYMMTVSPKCSDQHTMGLGDSDFGSQSMDCASGVHQLLFRQHSATPTDECASFQMTPSGGTYVQGKPSLSFPLKTEKSGGGGTSGSIGSGGKQRSDPLIVCQQVTPITEAPPNTFSIGDLPPRGRRTTEECISHPSQPSSSIEDPLDTARPSSSVETKIDQHSLSHRLSIPPPPSLPSIASIDEPSQSSSRPRRSVVVHPPPKIASTDDIIRARNSHASVVSAGVGGGSGGISAMRTSSTVEMGGGPPLEISGRNRSSTNTSTMSPLQPFDDQFTENSESFVAPLSRTKEGISQNNSGDPTLGPETSCCPNSQNAAQVQSGGSMDTTAVMQSATEQDSRLQYEEDENTSGNWRNVPILGLPLSPTHSPATAADRASPFVLTSVLKKEDPAANSIGMAKSATHTIKDRSPTVSIAGVANKSAGEGGASSSAGLTGAGGTGTSSGNTVNNALSASANGNDPPVEKQVTYKLDQDESNSDTYPIFLSSQQAVRRREGCCFRFLNNLPLLRWLATALQVIIVIMAIVIIVVSLKVWKFWEVWMFSLSDEVEVTETRVLTVHILLISTAIFFFLSKWCCYWYIQRRRRQLVEAALRPMPKKKKKEKRKHYPVSHRLLGETHEDHAAPPGSRRNSQNYAPDSSYPYSPLSGGRQNQHYDSGNYSDVPSVHFPPDENEVAGELDGDEDYRRTREEEDDAVANISSSHMPEGVVRSGRQYHPPSPHDDDAYSPTPCEAVIAADGEDSGEDEEDPDEDFECCCGNTFLFSFCGSCCDDDQAEEYITRKEDLSPRGREAGDLSSSGSAGRANRRQANSGTPPIGELSTRRSMVRHTRRRYRNDDDAAEMSTSMIIDQRRRIYRTPRKAGLCRRLWRTCCRVPSLICFARLVSLVLVIILLLLSVTSCLDGLIRFLMLSPVGYVWDANIKLKEDYMCKDIQMVAKCSGFSVLCNEMYYENNLTAQARMCPFCAPEDQLIIANYTKTCETVFKEKRKMLMTTFSVFLCLMMVLTVLSTLVFTSSLLSGAWVEEKKR